MVDRDLDGDDEHPLKLTIIPPTTAPKSKDEEKAEREKVGVGGDEGSDESPEAPTGGEESGE